MNTNDTSGNTNNTIENTNNTIENTNNSTIENTNNSIEKSGFEWNQFNLNIPNPIWWHKQNKIFGPLYK